MDIFPRTDREELLVDGTGTTEEERQKAIQTAMEKISDIVSKL